MVNYEMISGDSHIDLSWLPADLFTANAFGRIPNEPPRKIWASSRKGFAEKWFARTPDGSTDF